MYCIFILLQLNLWICNEIFFLFYIYYFLDSYHELMCLCIFNIYTVSIKNPCICSGIFFMIYVYFVDSYHECVL
jgi:hypothetical protein